MQALQKVFPSQGPPRNQRFKPVKCRRAGSPYQLDSGSPLIQNLYCKSGKSRLLWAGIKIAIADILTQFISHRLGENLKGSTVTVRACLVGANSTDVGGLRIDIKKNFCLFNGKRRFHISGNSTSSAIFTICFRYRK